MYSLLPCSLQLEMLFVLLALEPAKALLETEVHHQLQELLCTPGLDVIFPEQLGYLEKPLSNGLGRNLVFTSDIIIVNTYILFV